MIALLIAHPDALEGSAAVAQAIEIMEGNIEWMNLHYTEGPSFFPLKFTTLKKYRKNIFFFFTTSVADWLSNLDDSTTNRVKSLQKMADEQQCVTLPPEGGSSNAIHQNIFLLSFMVVFTSIVAKFM